MIAAEIEFPYQTQNRRRRKKNKGEKMARRNTTNSSHVAFQLPIILSACFCVIQSYFAFPFLSCDLNIKAIEHCFCHRKQEWKQQKKDTRLCEINNSLINICSAVMLHTFAKLFTKSVWKLFLWKQLSGD